MEKSTTGRPPGGEACALKLLLCQNLTLNEVFWRNGQQLVTTTNFAFFNGGGA